MEQCVDVLIKERILPEVGNRVVVWVLSVCANRSLPSSTSICRTVKANKGIFGEERLSTPASTARKHLAYFKLVLHVNWRNVEGWVDDTLSRFTSTFAIG